MQIIFPIAGRGERFSREGFPEIKPLIPVGGKTMIERACGSFPDGDGHEFIFICNNEHLENTRLRSVLEKARPGCEIIGIESHKKGPVHSVLSCTDKIADSKETIVSYGDFFVEWSFSGFENFVKEKKADAALPVFKGFHPAQFTGTKYAYIRTDNEMRILEIKEKESFTEDRLNEFASAGIHYFKSGGLMKDIFEEAVEKGLSLNGEFYASLPFNLFHERGLSAYAYEVEKFICFGTPADVRTYNYWYGHFVREKGGSK